MNMKRAGVRRTLERAIVIVMDGAGIGELPDADKYGDRGTNTLCNTAKAVGGLKVPNLERLGLGNIAEAFGLLLPGVESSLRPLGAFGRMAEASAGKDTTTGHWELAGVVLTSPFPTYPGGFPGDIIQAFETAIGRKVLGNKAASGTEIIKELGEKHMKTGRPIVYTSADSVFQIAAHEDIIPVEELYRLCEIARGLLHNGHNVARVIARPFTGKPGSFIRTPRRRDYSVKPPRKTILEAICDAGLDVLAVGKIEDVFGGLGITGSVHATDNRSCIEATLGFMRLEKPGLIFTNLVDFDTLYGHRNDPAGFARALTEFDGRIPDILGNMRESDVLFLTADHGCDPVAESTDHTREYVPLLVYGKAVEAGAFLGTRKTFADVGSTIRDALGIKADIAGTGFGDLCFRHS